MLFCFLTQTTVFPSISIDDGVLVCTVVLVALAIVLASLRKRLFNCCGGPVPEANFVGAMCLGCSEASWSLFGAFCEPLGVSWNGSGASGAPNVSKFALSASKLAPRASKLAPRESKLAPKSDQVGPKSVQVGPKSVEVSPRSAPVGPRTSDRALTRGKPRNLTTVEHF